MLRWYYNKQQTLLLIGHTASRFGDQAWNFVVPLILVVLSHGSLWVASFYALCSRLGILALGSSLGRYMDTHERIQVVRNGAITCIISVTLVTGLFTLLLLNKDISACFQGNFMDFFLHSNCAWSIKCLIIVLSFVGSGEAIGAFLTKVSVERDWIVELIDSDNLPFLSSFLRRIDLLSEITAPILVGWFVNTSNTRTTLQSLLWVGCFDAISFLLEYGMLWWIFSFGNMQTRVSNTTLDSYVGIPSEDDLQQQTSLDYSEQSASFTIFLRHPLCLVVLAYACLWFNALSPHGILFTSYLAQEDISNSILGIFRGSGALFGFLGTLLFPWLEKVCNLSMTCLVSITFETITLIFSCIFIWSSNSEWSLFLSLFMIVLSRVGLYIYELGESLYLQRYVEPSQRGRMGAVEGILTNAANLGLVMSGLVLSAPHQFLYLWISSAAFAALGCLLFICWCALYVEDNHYHEDPWKPNHLHTPYQQQQLVQSMNTDNSGAWHTHLHKR